MLERLALEDRCAEGAKSEARGKLKKDAIDADPDGSDECGGSEEGGEGGGEGSRWVGPDVCALLLGARTTWSRMATSHQRTLTQSNVRQLAVNEAAKNIAMIHDA